QLHAELVDRSEKCAAKRFHRFQRQRGFEYLLARSLLHFVGSAIRVGHDNELGQPFKRALPILSDFNNPISDRARFARAGGSDHGEVTIQLANESLSRLLVRNGHHFDCSSSSRTNAGYVSAHFSFSRSVSIGSVASGYFVTTPKSA